MNVVLFFFVFFFFLLLAPANVFVVLVLFIVLFLFSWSPPKKRVGWSHRSNSEMDNKWRNDSWKWDRLIKVPHTTSHAPPPPPPLSNETIAKVILTRFRLTLNGILCKEHSMENENENENEHKPTFNIYFSALFVSPNHVLPSSHSFDSTPYILFAVCEYLSMCMYARSNVRNIQWLNVKCGFK